MSQYYIQSIVFIRQITTSINMLQYLNDRGMRKDLWKLTVIPIINNDNSKAHSYCHLQLLSSTFC